MKKVIAITEENKYVLANNLNQIIRSLEECKEEILEGKNPLESRANGNVFFEYLQWEVKTIGNQLDGTVLSQLLPE